jgi:hypothetical protein
MPNQTLVVVAGLNLAADTIVSLQTGKVPGFFHKFLRYRTMYGPITREKRPGRYWLYVFCQSLAILMFTTWWLFLKP